MTKSYIALGVNYGGHDTSAAVMRDGCLLAASEQERYSLDKHSRRFPLDAIQDSLSKAGVIRYTKGLAVELGSYNINVNSISPGAVWTDFQKNAINADKKHNEQDAKNLFDKRYVPMMPLGRTQTPNDIGNLAVFLASDDACNITGQNINVDSGAVIE